ncbi:calcium/sodium antiporter [Prosthecobacter dejongeii]|uniref:Cation:H+ antiporter n=1 Tax=Prosthecobacter dejongeii TaxID=48465 RepID=A0A7W8DNG9_9BACT|nr:calcium/sodium antiporter [Prosthecobacter dejongeii]MBB5036080.1 cation:H+ antiporter [Prosthecobacter dejongeii]
MIESLTFILLGLILLYFGGEGLVRGSSALALRLGLTPLVVGLTVVAFGTSAPELVVSMKAALDGEGAIAIGNVLGSNSLNIGLILGLTALICPLTVQLQILRMDAPLMVVVTMIGGWMLHDLHLSRLEGGLLVAGLVAYVIFTVMYAKRVRQSPAVVEEYAEALPTPKGSVGRDVVFMLGGLGLLVVGSRFMVDGAVSLARLYGISEAVIGLTIVAAGTSMPELVTCVVAALKKEPDIALGNIIGSNIFNILGILGGASLLRPLHGTGIQMTDIYIGIAFAIVLVPILRTGQKLMRWEGALLLAAYVGYMVWLWPKE